MMDFDNKIPSKFSKELVLKEFEKQGITEIDKQDFMLDKYHWVDNKNFAFSIKTGHYFSEVEYVLFSHPKYAIRYLDTYKSDLFWIRLMNRTQKSTYDYLAIELSFLRSLHSLKQFQEFWTDPASPALELLEQFAQGFNNFADKYCRVSVQLKMQKPSAVKEGVVLQFDEPSKSHFFELKYKGEESVLDIGSFFKDIFLFEFKLEKLTFFETLTSIANAFLIRNFLSLLKSYCDQQGLVTSIKKPPAISPHRLKADFFVEIHDNTSSSSRINFILSYDQKSIDTSYFLKGAVPSKSGRQPLSFPVDSPTQWESALQQISRLYFEY